MNNHLKGTELFDNDNYLIRKKGRLFSFIILMLSTLLVGALCFYLYFLNTKVEQLTIKNNRLETRISEYKEKSDEYYLKFKDLTEIVESKTN